MGLFATEAFRGDILVSLKPAGQRRPMDEIFDDLRKEIKHQTPDLKTEFLPLIVDQIDDLEGAISPVEIKVFGPDPVKLRELATKVGEIAEAAGVEDVNSHVHLGNPDILVRPKSSAMARAGLTGQEVESQLRTALYGQVASTLPEQDRITAIRVRYPDAVRYDKQQLPRLPISLPGAGPIAPTQGSAASGEAAPAGTDFVLLGNVALIEEARSPQRTAAGEPAAGDRGHRRTRRARSGKPPPRVGREAGRNCSSRRAIGGSLPAPSAPSRSRSPVCWRSWCRPRLSCSSF